MPASELDHKKQINIQYADVAHTAEHILGKDEVMGSIPIISSKLPFSSAVSLTFGRVRGRISIFIYKL